MWWSSTLPARALEPVLPEGVELAVQPTPDGTGGAVVAGMAQLDAAESAPVIVLSGDVPLLGAPAIAALAQAHEQSGAAATMVTSVLEDPSGYGRVVRDAAGAVQRVVETKGSGDATPEELQIREVNAGVYAFDAEALRGALPRLSADNAQRELYLPQVLDLLRADGLTVAAHLLDDPALMLGVNDRVALAQARKLAQRAIHERHMLAGVDIVDPDATVIDVGVQIGEDTVIEPFTTIRGATRIGAGCTVKHSYLIDCVLEDGVSVGPFAYLRPGAMLRAGAKAGTFVEIKNSDIGQARKSRTSPTSATPTSASARTSGRARSRPTTTVRTSTARRSASACTAAWTPRSWRPSPSATTPTRRPARSSPRTCPTARWRSRGPSRRTSSDTRSDGSPFTLRGEMSSVIDTSASSRASLPIDYNKRLMLFSGRANPQLAIDIADKLGVDLGPITLKTFSSGEVYCRYEESIRGADVFIVQSICGNPQTGITANDSLMELLFMIDAAVGASAHRVIAVTPWFGYSRQDKKSAPARADLGAAGRAHAGVGGRRPGADDGPARRPDPGVLPEAGGPHDGAVHAHPVLRRPRAVRPGGGRAGCGQGQAEQELRLEDRRRAGDPRQGAPGPAGRRDRLRDR